MLPDYPVLPDQNPFHRVACDMPSTIFPPHLRNSGLRGRPNSARPKRSLRCAMPGHTQEQALTCRNSHNITMIAPFVQTTPHSTGSKGAMGGVNLSKRSSLSGWPRHRLDQETMAPHPPTMPKHIFLAPSPPRPSAMPDYIEQGTLNINMERILSNRSALPMQCPPQGNTDTRGVIGRNKWLQHPSCRRQIANTDTRCVNGRDEWLQHPSCRLQIAQQALTRRMGDRQGTAKMFMDPWKRQEKHYSHLRKVSAHLVRLQGSNSRGGLEMESEGGVHNTGVPQSM